MEEFLKNWQIDPLEAKPAFLEYKELIENSPGVKTEFLARPGISFSLRATNPQNKNRNILALVDVVDDEPDNRWLSVCFYADSVTDPDEAGDFVPQGLLGEDALCFNLDENDPEIKKYIKERLAEALAGANK